MIYSLDMPSPAGGGASAAAMTRRLPLSPTKEADGHLWNLVWTAPEA